MPSGIRYCSVLEPTGYGHAAVAYVRGLVNAGASVHWEPMAFRGGAVVRLDTDTAVPLLELAGDDDALRDLPALLAATSRPIACDTVVAHAVPEYWPQLFAPGRRNVGNTVWEADLPPAHWVPLLNRASAVCVPCRMNAAGFAAAGVRVPVHVVPHVRRHAWNDFAPAAVAALRAQLGIPERNFVFYSINTWDPRKALPLLLAAFVLAFGPDDPVSLVLKTDPTGHGDPPFYQVLPTPQLAQAAIDRAAAQAGRPPPSVCLLPYRLTGRGIDLLHELGDCYVSLAHGEGWALGAFDAATRGTPVLMTGWGGQLDYLGDDWPGALPYRLSRVPVWPPPQPSYWPSQHWADPDLAGAVAALRMAATRPPALAAAAARIADGIATRFAEPVIARQLLAALDG